MNLYQVCAINGGPGLILNRCDGNYGDGKQPSQWTGSLEILEAFMATEEPVKYGQCWVIAGLVTTSRVDFYYSFVFLASQVQVSAE